MLQIIKFHPQYIIEVIQLWQLCGLVTPKNNPESDINIKLQVAPELFLIGTENNRVVATIMAGFEGHRGWINYLAVHPTEQGKGYAKTLMQEAEDRLRAKGCPKINLQVRSSNKKVISFYQSLGYQKDDVVSLGKRLNKES